jgi:hypothetical protein
MIIIETPKGTVRVISPSVELLEQLRDLLPFGIARLREPTAEGARYGIVMQCDEEEVCCVKQQPKELDRESALRWLEVQHWMCTEAYGRYVGEGFCGAYLAGPYLRQRENGLWESGVAHFIFPSANGVEAQQFPFEHAFDNQFGHGATTMFERYAQHFMRAFRESPISPPGYFGMDVRTRLHLQSFGMYFMALGSQVICLRARLRENEDAAWTILASRGVEDVVHLPAVPLAIKAHDLPVTKGEKREDG